MSATIDYCNARAGWRFVIADLRGPDGQPTDLTGFTVSVTFRPDADRATDILDCSTDNGHVTVTDGITGSDGKAMGPTVAILVPAAARAWSPARPTLVVGDVMIAQPNANPPTETAIRRLAFIALPGT